MYRLAICPDLLSAGECSQQIEQAKQGGWERLSTRKRFQFDDKELADMLWGRIQSLGYPFPEVQDEYGAWWTASALNTHFRVARYDLYDHFPAHEDGFWQSSVDYRSFASLIVYLNDDYKGGETHYTAGITIHPHTGMGLLFVCHNFIHQGKPVTDGTKYILRSDVMYTPKDGLLPFHEQRETLYQMFEEAEEKESDCLYDRACAYERGVRELYRSGQVYK